MRIGELVYLKNVGFPFDRTDDGCESWEGVSAVVSDTHAGTTRDMVEVEPIFPVKCGDGRSPMKSCLFHAHQVKREDRPWLRKHLRDIMKLKNTLRKAALVAEQIDEITQTIR